MNGKGIRCHVTPCRVNITSNISSYCAIAKYQTNVKGKLGGPLESLPKSIFKIQDTKCSHLRLVTVFDSGGRKAKILKNRKYLVCKTLGASLCRIIVN